MRAPVVLPFLLRRARVSLFPRPGAASRVEHDPAALSLDPGVTWIGHAAVLVRLDGAAFITDPVFSHRVSPLRFAGPPRLVPPDVPLLALPRLDFALLSHDHSAAGEPLLGRAARAHAGHEPGLAHGRLLHAARAVEIAGRVERGGTRAREPG